MSLSPRKSPPLKRRAPGLRTCIACGLRRVERCKVDVNLRNEKVVRNVDADVCANCGERYFDAKAMDKIEAVRFPRLTD